MENYKIQILGENQCVICGKEFIYRKQQYKDYRSKHDLWEVLMKVEHSECVSLKKKIDRLKKELFECEYELLCKRVPFSNI